MSIEILFEDEHIVAVNKPAGLMVHGDGRSDEYTLADWVLENYPGSKDVGEPIETKDGKTIYRPGIVHRLDKDTSGVMLIAKTTEGYTHLKEQFKNREVNKVYRALVYGEMKKDEVVVDAKIGRSKTFAKWTAIPKALRGTTRDAETHFLVLDRLEGFTYIEARPKTGRTHQIRVHLQYLNYPIVADRLYAGKRYDSDAPEKSLGFDRQALHAHIITFTDLGGTEQMVEAPLPQDFINILK